MKLFGPLILALSAEAGIGGRVVEMVKSSSDNNEKRLMGEWVQWKNAIGKVYETIEEEIER